MSIGNRIRDARENLGLSRGQLADMIGVTISAISNYENNISFPKEPILFQLFHALGCDANYLFQDNLSMTQVGGGFSETPLDNVERQLLQKYRALDSHGRQLVDLVVDKEHERVLDIVPPTAQDNLISIDAYNFPASAGSGMFFSDVQKTAVQAPANAMTMRADFAVPISGNSMEPDFSDGDTVLIKSQPIVEPGEIGIFIVNGQLYIKQLGENRLISKNPAYADIPLREGDSIYCMGRVIGKLQRES